MKLDERIVLLTDIITCFNIEKAKSFIGQKGYFADIISSYQNLGNITYGTLTEIKDNDYPFEEDNHECWRFFIPESLLKPKPKEKQYRPFKDTKEFFIKTNFEAGDVIRVYSKAHNTECYLMLIGWTDDMLMLGNFRGMCFDELFEWFELWDGEENFIPFGVLE